MRHGTRYAYETKGCRCDTCRTNHSQRKQRERIARFAEGRLNHGTTCAYDSGCRCDDCRATRRARYLKGITR